MSESDQDLATPFIRRKQKNLEYFRKFRPELYDFFSTIHIESCELVITPGNSDVDLLDNGLSVYRHLARDFSIREAQQFLDENSGSSPAWTVAPPYPTKSETGRFAARSIRACFDLPIVSKENYKGLYRGKCYPSVVFLGCGLGYHIEYLSEKADIIDAVIFEPDAERFALSLFTVDWENICKKFRRKGRSISFCIAKNKTRENIRQVLGAKLAEMIPIYPYLNIYYNHLANVDLYKIAKDVERDLPVVGVNWGDYDFELRGFKNSLHNVKSDSFFFKENKSENIDRPLIIVGSGPSLDERIDDLKSVRDRVVIVSAGTGLRALLNQGVRPDYHVELDADYLIYEMMLDLRNQHDLDGIELLCSVSVNPLLKGLFKEKTIFFPGDNYIPYFYGAEELMIQGCSPTCTNAALVLSFAMGYRNIFLFGTDYGFKKKSKDHSRYSIYGNEVKSSFSEEFHSVVNQMQESQSLFEVDAVDGTKILTQGDFFAAKKAVERVAHILCEKGEADILWNCSDGAEIANVQWVSRSDFLDRVKFLSRSDGGARQKELTEKAITRVSFSTDVEVRVQELIDEVCSSAMSLYKVLATARLDGRDDLVIVCNEVRDCLNRVGVGSGRKTSEVTQMMGWEIMKGTVLRFLQIGLCHGLAHERLEEVVKFSNGWRREFLGFLGTAPSHFTSVVSSGNTVDEDPWIAARLSESEPPLFM